MPDSSNARDESTQQLVERLLELTQETGAVLAALHERQGGAAEHDEAVPEPESLTDLRTVRARLTETLPTLVIAWERYENLDGVLTEPVLAVVEAVGRLEAATDLLPELCVAFVRQAVLDVQEGEEPVEQIGSPAWMERVRSRWPGSA